MCPLLNVLSIITSKLLKISKTIFFRKFLINEINMAKINRKLQVTVRSQKRPNLPKSAVNILTRWLEENCTNPYPSESMKKTLMEVTNLTKNQVIFRIH